MVVERNAHALFTTEHLTRHECVENPCTCEREAEIEAKQPPVFDLLVELEKEQIHEETRNDDHFRFKIQN